MQLFTNKNILVGVTGSIALYKTLELIRLYIKAGATVKVIMTQSAKKFITPLSFEAISQNSIIDDENEEWSQQSVHNHIALGKWADIFVIAPATANTINKLANGIADNLLTQTALAYPRKKLLSPAANTNMLHHPVTKASLKMLQLCNFSIIQSQTKELACRDVGDGALADPEDIFHQTAQELLVENYWKDRKVIITGGGTIEKIDDVRYLSNFSSGKMAASVATALHYKGADVCLITTQKTDHPKQIHTLFVQNTQEMYTYLQSSLKVAKKGKLSSATLMDSSNIELVQKKPYFFSIAAVSDYIPKYPQNGKIKKADIGEKWDLQLSKNVDILNAVDKKGIYTIGFKAELDPLMAQENAKNMINQKNIDAVCLNIIDQNNPFAGDTNEIELFTKEQSITMQKNTKLHISLEILKSLQGIFHEQ